MKNKSLLPILLLAGFVLGGCNGWNPFAPKSSGEQSESDTTQYGVEIANKDAFGEWYKGTTRNLDVTLTPAANPLQELNKKNLTVSVSDETVVKATGLGLNALSTGTVTITVDYHGVKDSVEVTILDNSPKAKYGTQHEGDEADPFTNEEAVMVAKSPKYEGEVYYVRGIISSFYYAPGARTDGNVAYFLTPAEPGGEKFEVFKCYKEDGSALTDDDIWVGGEATAYGAFTVYNSTQAETTSAVFVSCTGEKPHDRVVVDKTFAEVLAANVELEDGADTWDYFRFEAYVTSKDGSNFFLTATQGEELHQATYSGGQTYYDNAFEIYRLEDTDALAYMLKNAKVKVTSVVKNYHGQAENLFALAAADIELLEAGTSWDVAPEPDVLQGTLAEFIANTEGNGKRAYILSAEVKSFKDGGAANDKYGNMVLTDGENDLIIYGSTMTETALVWDGTSNKYIFTNPQDFQTNADSNAIKIGDTVQMKLIRADYKTTIEGSGIILSVTPGEGGGQEDVPEPDVVEGTLAEFIANTDGNYKVAYHLSAEVKSFKNGSENHDKYGNMVLTDGENDLIVYGSTATATALTWNNVDAYAFSNPQDFITNETTGAIAIGDTVEMKIVRCDFTKDGVTTIEGTGIVLSVTPGTPVIPDENVRTLKYTGDTTTNMAATGNAELVSLDPTEFEVDADKGETTNFPGLNKAGDIRLYSLKSNEAVGNGANFTVTYLKGTIESIKIDFKQNPGDCVVSVGGEEVEGTEGVYEIAATSFNVKNGYVSDGSANTQVQINKIEITVAEGPVDPVQLPQPVGNFSGYAVALDDSNVFVIIALGDEMAFVNAGGTKVAATYTFNNETGEVVIENETLGTVSAIYDADNNALTQVTLSGSMASMLKNNGQITLNGAKHFWNCDGTTEELQATFKRRWHDGSKWNIDTTNADRITSYTDSKVGGTGAMKVRGYSGGKVGLNLQQDLAETEVKNIGAWVYNSSDADINISLFIYKSAGLTNHAQIGTVVAKAGQWTYISCGFGSGFVSGTDTLYNIQFYVEYKATALVYDNIALF